MSGTQKVNKLSRKSKKKSAQSQAKSLNDSLADFSEPKSQRGEKKSEIFNSGSAADTPNSAPKLPEKPNSAPKPPEDLDAAPEIPEQPDSAPVLSLADCPMCGKQFKPGLVVQRNSHLKSCGNKNGMRTEKLVELRRLEEKQAEERAALGFHSIQNVEKPQKKVQRKNKHIAKDGGADADLELALALSISAQSGGQNKHKDDVENSGSNGSNATEALKCSQNGKTPMWLPQAPVPQKKRGRKKVMGVTVLQTRSDEERERLVGESVAAILYPEEVVNPQMDRIGRATLPERKLNDRLCSIEDPEMMFWSLASLPKTAKNNQFLADKLENYIDVKQLDDCSDKKQNKTVEMVEKSNSNEQILDQVKKSVQPSLKNLSDEWQILFKSRKRTDFKILCREEEVVLCHRLVLEVRCPQMLKETVKETSNCKEEELVIWSSFDQKVVSVLIEFLYCGVLNISVIETIEELIQLKQLATLNKIGDIIEILKEVTIEEANDNDITGGFCEESLERDLPTATQNLDALLDCLDNSEKGVGDKREDNDGEKVEEERSEEEDWDEVCQFMTQKVKKSAETYDNEDADEDLLLKLSESDDDDSIFDEEQDEVNKTSTPVKSISIHSESLEMSNFPESPKCAKMTITRASSPDMFGSDNDDDDGEIVESDWNLPQIIQDNNSSKRKSQISDGSDNSIVKKMRTLSPIHSTSPDIHPISSPVRPISSVHPISPVRLDFGDYSNELPTPYKSRIGSKSKCNDEEEFGDVIDLTQRTPTPENIISSNDSEKLAENIVSSAGNSSKSAIYSAPNSPISIKSSKSPFSSQNSLKSVAASPKSSYSPATSITTTPKSSLVKSKSLTTSPKSSLLESKSTTVTLINKLVEDLSDTNIDDKHTEGCLKTLCSVEVTVPMMLETEVGKVVRKLRDREGRIGRLAGRLVARWKRLIFAYNGPEVKPTQSPCKAASGDDKVPSSGDANQEVNNDGQIGENEKLRINDENGFGENEENGLGDYDDNGLGDYDENGLGDNYENGLGDYDENGLGDYDENGLCDYDDNGLGDYDENGLGDIDENGLDDNDENDLGDNGDNAIDKDSTYEEIEESLGEIARLQMEDSAIWRSENEPTPVSPQAQVYVTPHRTVQSIRKSGKQLLTPQNRPKNATPLRIQSLKNSAMKSATPKSGNPFMTPENVRNRELPDATPMSDYDMMLTPELREELHRFGLKAVPRRKAVQLLQFIYDKTHPFVDKENSSPIVAAKNSPKPNSISKSKMKTSAKKVRIAHQPSTSKSSVNSNIKKTGSCSSKKSVSGIQTMEDDQSGSGRRPKEDDQPEMPEEDFVNLSQGSATSDQSEGFDVPEESIMEMDDEDEDEISASQMPTEGSLWSQLRFFINSKPDLHHSILIFEPIWLKQFVALVKQAGIKCKIAQVMDFLDHECITFRTETNRVNRQKKKASPKKKTKKSPLKTKSPKKGVRKKEKINM